MQHGKLPGVEGQFVEEVTLMRPCVVLTFAAVKGLRALAHQLRQKRPEGEGPAGCAGLGAASARPTAAREVPQAPGAPWARQAFAAVHQDFAKAHRCHSKPRSRRAAHARAGAQGWAEPSRSGTQGLACCCTGGAQGLACCCMACRAAARMPWARMPAACTKARPAVQAYRSRSVAMVRCALGAPMGSRVSLS